MRLAIISDTHMPRGARALPAACLERLRTADAILHAGDFSALSVFEELRAIGPPLHAVHGNVDAPEVRALLPSQAVFEIGGARIGMVHDAGPAAGRLARLRRSFPDSDAVVFGHTHMPEHLEREGFQIFNPGSPTERRRSPRHTMGMGDVRDGRLELRLVDLS